MNKKQAKKIDRNISITIDKYGFDDYLLKLNYKQQTRYTCYHVLKLLPFMLDDKGNIIIRLPKWNK